MKETRRIHILYEVFFVFVFVFFFSFLKEYDNSTKSVRDQLKELSQPLKFSSTTLKFLLSKFYIR